MDTPPFRFLSAAQFGQLSADEKAIYLARAVKELKKMTDTLTQAVDNRNKGE